MASEDNQKNALRRAEQPLLAELEEFNILELEDRFEFTATLDDADVVCPEDNTNCGTNCSCPAPPPK